MLMLYLGIHFLVILQFFIGTCTCNLVNVLVDISFLCNGSGLMLYLETHHSS